MLFIFLLIVNTGRRVKHVTGESNPDYYHIVVLLIMLVFALNIVLLRRC